MGSGHGERKSTTTNCLLFDALDMDASSSWGSWLWARQVLVNYTPEQLEDSATYGKALHEMIASSTSVGIVSDDEPIAVLHRTESGWLIVDTSSEALKPERRLWREFGLLSDQAWDRATKPNPRNNKAKGFG